MELWIIIQFLVASTLLWIRVDSGLCAHKELDPDSKEIITSLDNKLTSFESVLSQVDNNLKLLNEKSLVWDLFRHHVDSWNDRIKALDDKIDLIKRTQEESKIVETKLTSLEFTLNHILSKVVYLSDNRYDSKCCSQIASPSPPNDSHNKIITLEKEIKREITTRLSNILRHVLNIENGNCRLNRMNVSSVVVGPKNIVQVVQPVDTTANTLRVLYEKVENFTNQFNMKQFTGFVKKNSKMLDELVGSVRKVDERAKDMQNEQKLSSNYCQSMSEEIVTFTSSSGALLKKIEKIASKIHTKLAEAANEEEENDSMSSTTIGYGEDSFELQDSSIENDFRQPDINGCHEVTSNRIDGIYKFSDTEESNDAGRDFNKRLCVFPKEGYGYTVVQNRGPYEQQENFNRSWTDYRNGFGNLGEDFWFGNEFIYQLVQQDNYELRIEMEDFDGVRVWAEYSTFQIESEKQNYTLILGGYKGAVNDAMLYHHGQQFSTYDRMNDKTTDPCCPCSPGFGSGWWFNSCSQANLNGIYRYTPRGHSNIGITWQNWHPDYSLRRTRMLIRPKQVWSGEIDDDVEIFLKK